MPMSGYQLKEVRKVAGLTQAELAEQVGLSRKTINEAEALGDAIVKRSIEMAVRGVTLTAEARALHLADASMFRAAGDEIEASRSEYAAAVLTGNFASDVRTIYNLAGSVARLTR